MSHSLSLQAQCGSSCRLGTLAISSFAALTSPTHPFCSKDKLMTLMKTRSQSRALDSQGESLALHFSRRLKSFLLLAHTALDNSDRKSELKSRTSCPDVYISAPVNLTTATKSKCPAIYTRLRTRLGLTLAVSEKTKISSKSAAKAEKSVELQRIIEEPGKSCLFSSDED